MKRIKSKNLMAVIACLGLLNLTSCTEQEHNTGYETSEANTSSCECDSSWFPHSQTENPNETDPNNFLTNCDFHQWSWQKFLWLTEEDEDTIVFFQNNLNQVSSSLTVLSTPNSTNVLNLLSTEDPNTGVLHEPNLQAGSSGILKTNKFYSDQDEEYTVFYSLHVNDQMLNECTQFGNSIAVDSTLAPDNDSTFSIGALELKASWVATDAIPADSLVNYYITDAIFGNATTTIDTVKVALLGLHVVGRVVNHPEFIWATFEHESMSPNYDWTNSTSSTDAIITATTGDTLLFTNLDTTSGSMAITYDGTTNAPYQAQKAYNLYELGVPRTNGNAFISTTQNGADNFNNITSINACVKSNLGAASKWSHYFYKGSIWIDTDNLTSEEQNTTIIGLSTSNSLGNVSTDTLLRGSLGLSNMTLETYTQTFESFSSHTFDIHDLPENKIGNCFGCHTASSNSGDSYSMLYVSHLFNGYLSTLNGATEEEARIERVKKVKMMIESYK